MQLKFLSTVFMMLFSFHHVIAQRTITGTVTDSENSAPLIGASILVTGSTTGTVTDFDGNFTLEVLNDAESLDVSYTGYTTQTVSIAGGITTVNVQLESGSVLDEVVVIAYGTVKKSDMTGAVSSMKEKDFNKGVANSVDQLITGRAAGVQVSQTSSEPGWRRFN